VSTKGFFDFHLHTHASDGCLSPNELVQHLVSYQVKIAAITDHDTIDGVRALLSHPHEQGLEMVPGIEVSTLWQQKEVHVLIYQFDLPPINDTFLADLSRRREERMQKMLYLFQKTGFNIAQTDLPPSSAPGRWHLATALTKLGYVRSPTVALRRWLQKGRRYYIKLNPVSIHQATTWAKKVRGLCVLAHPHLYFATAQQFDSAMSQETIPFDGLELLHTTFPPQDYLSWVKIAEKWNLSITGGSDFHRFKHHSRVGRGLGGRTLFADDLYGIFLKNPSKYA